MALDDVLQHVDEIGKYQKIRLFLVCLVSTVCAFHALNMVFVGAKPKFMCEANEVNLSTFTDVSYSDWNALLGKADEKKCNVYKSEEILNSIRSGNTTVEMLMNSSKLDFGQEPCTSWIYSREVYGPTIVSDFDLVCNQNWLRSFAKTLYFAGRLLGAVIFGQLSDMFGRKPMFFVGLGMLLIVGTIASVAPSMYVFTPFYILQGAAQTGLFLVAFTMCTELVGPKYRLHAGFLVHVFYSMGYMTLSLLSYVIRDWRNIERVITLPVILFAAYWWILPESVRWLLSRNRMEEAKTVICKVAKVNKVDISDEVLEQLKDKNEEPESDRKYTFVDLLHPLPMLFLTLNVWFNWLVNSLVYYGLSLGTGKLGGDPYINFLIAGVVEIPAKVICVLSLNRFGRRWPLFLTMFIGGIACIISGFIPPHMVNVQITFAMIGKVGITASYGIIYLMAAELFPTVVRNIGMGTSSMSARVGGMLAPQILELSEVWTPLPMLIFGGMSVAAGSLALLFPETSGRPLPQTIEEALNANSKKLKGRITENEDLHKNL